MRRDGSFESGDMVELSVDHGGPAVEVPIENVRNYWEGF